MSYRSVKRILGETSLERKCRFLLGAGMLILIASSFWFYSYLNSELIYEQNLRLARSMVGQELANKHGVWTKAETTEKNELSLESLWTQTRPNSLKNADIDITSASQNPAQTAYTPRAFGEDDYQILEYLKQK